MSNIQGNAVRFEMFAVRYAGFVNEDRGGTTVSVQITEAVETGEPQLYPPYEVGQTEDILRSIMVQVP